MSAFRLAFLCIIVGCLFSCRQEPGKLFEPLAAGKTGIQFKNILRETPEFNVLEYGYFYNGGGVAIGDINNDGLPDIYFTGNLVSSRLYLNKGDFEFEEIAEKAGVDAAGLWNTGVTMADVNGDGWLDMYVCRSAAALQLNRENLLFINNGPSEETGEITFSEHAKFYGINNQGYSTQSAFFDYDRDGDLDLYVLNHSIQEYAGFSQLTSAYKKRNSPFFGDKLYRNELIPAPDSPPGGFTDVTMEAGILRNIIGFGLGLAVSDLNQDGWPDIYVSNDYNEQDYLYINQQNGTFKESLEEQLNHVSLFSMGNDIADINNDGYPDILTLDMLPGDHYRQKMTSGPDHYEKNQVLKQNGFYHQSMRNMLQLNNGDGSFSEIGQLAGISNTDWSWAGLIADFDNDGYNDIYVSNGYMRDYTNMDFMSYTMNEKLKNQKEGTEFAIMALIDKMPAIETADYMFRNKGDLSFEDVGKAWGLDAIHMTNGAAYADLDNDGDLDLVANHVNEIASIYENHSEIFSNHHYLKIRLKGKDTNTYGIGAKVWIKTASGNYFRELFHSRGFQSAVEPVVHIGLGKDSIIQELKIQWPLSGTQIFHDLKANQLLEIEESGKILTDQAVEKAFFSSATKSTPAFTHIENAFVDFKQTPLLPRMLSTQGPKLSSADINFDGLEDMYVGGAKGQAGRLFIQKKTGKWEPALSQPWELDADSEDLESLFLDVDLDGDLDLYVCSGGNDVKQEDVAIQDRLYINQGGTFIKSTDRLPDMPTSTMALVAFDVEGDGDQDLFVGGRLVPGRYPEIPRSYLLLNDGKGYFSDGTQDLAPELSFVGHVCDVIAFEHASNPHSLVIVGEWMPITFVNRFKQGKMTLDSTTLLQSSSGWWNVVHQNDFDQDGDPDLILGNQGLNEQFQASAEEPVGLYAKDFDGNGSLDPIMTYFIGGKSYPMPSRDDLLGQLAHLKKKYPSYSKYADQQLADIFTVSELKLAQKLYANQLASVYLENEGKGKYKMTALPIEAQFAPIYALTSFDIDGDEKLDFIAAGNFSSTRVKFGESDASFGQVFLGDGKGGFRYIPQSTSGFKLRGDTRDVLRVQTKSHNFLIFAQNNGPLRSYKSIKNLHDLE